MDFDLCEKLKANKFPQNNLWELRRPNVDVMLSMVEIDTAYWKGDVCGVEGGGTKAEGRDLVNALGMLWLNQNTQ